MRSFFKFFSATASFAVLATTVLLSTAAYAQDNPVVVMETNKGTIQI